MDQNLKDWLKSFFKILAISASAYFIISYLVLPAFWTHYEHHKKMQGAPKTTITAEGIPGDPLNVALVGEESDIVHAMTVSGWTMADPETLKTSVKTVKSILFNKPYPKAPVSDLFLWNRREDLAFEKAVGPNPKQRHHVRFWKSRGLSEQGLFWIGAATFDRSVGISHRTGQITHHIAPDVDAERDKLIDDLKQAGQLDKIYQVTGIGPTLFGKNSNGDPYFSDGELVVGVLIKDRVYRAAPPVYLRDPARIQWKQKIWSWIHRIFRANHEF